VINALAQVAVLVGFVGVLWLARYGPRALVRRLSRPDVAEAPAGAAAPVRPGWAKPAPPEAEHSRPEAPAGAAAPVRPGWAKPAPPEAEHSRPEAP
jgi:hypothetical protein